MRLQDNGDRDAAFEFDKLQIEKLKSSKLILRFFAELTDNNMANYPKVNRTVSITQVILKQTMDGSLVH